MAPANAAAQETEEFICAGLFKAAVQQVQWSDGAAIVIANWQALHGRGPEPWQEEERILQRIYVR
jgi:hypothetical protein